MSQVVVEDFLEGKTSLLKIYIHREHGVTLGMYLFSVLFRGLPFSVCGLLCLFFSLSLPTVHTQTGIGQLEGSCLQRHILSASLTPHLKPILPYLLPLIFPCLPALLAFLSVSLLV